MKKSEIRKKILKIRSQKNNDKFILNPSYIFKVLKKKKIIGKNLGGYYPYNYEVEIIEILEKFEKQGYKLSLPKIKSKFQMDFFKWSFNDPLEINKYGIPEPVSKKIKFPDIFLVPLVAFDNRLNRIGYGGGFYDRYLEKIQKNKKIVTIGLAYSFQEIKRIPADKYDIKLDYILTEKKLLK